mmetsp:Transcript_18496/g.31903  ORF Transcript_18496/g.31903 Transcript_18496/m.31903 type:complete len:492 (+) Transcript_18496:259-1734(+)|eukprot:CAMPEP_0196655062 /NCGR_PEP_ID=MMETSP1086-20130531/4813_1 /TAXON_ID=77921 /ORGANISM="Cyanoptyche  gloeocystis , Strain SAG4.97" /LENGTH=491 /DNA_ID=CAMNT_0041987165 /DNA_START=249 /DNA_END=1724 /DNA_ORIENTATION=+
MDMSQKAVFVDMAAARKEEFLRQNPGFKYFRKSGTQRRPNSHKDTRRVVSPSRPVPIRPAEAKERSWPNSPAVATLPAVASSALFDDMRFYTPSNSLFLPLLDQPSSLSPVSATSVQPSTPSSLYYLSPSHRSASPAPSPSPSVVSGPSVSAAQGAELNFAHGWPTYYYYSGDQVVYLLPIQTSQPDAGPSSDSTAVATPAFRHLEPCHWASCASDNTAAESVCLSSQVRGQGWTRAVLQGSGWAEVCWAENGEADGDDGSAFMDESWNWGSSDGNHAQRYVSPTEPQPSDHPYEALRFRTLKGVDSKCRGALGGRTMENASETVLGETSASTSAVCFSRGWPADTDMRLAASNPWPSPHAQPATSNAHECSGPSQQWPPQPREVSSPGVWIHSERQPQHRPPQSLSLSDFSFQAHQNQPYQRRCLQAEASDPPHARLDARLEQGLLCDQQVLFNPCRSVLGSSTPRSPSSDFDVNWPVMRPGAAEVFEFL